MIRVPIVQEPIIYSIFNYSSNKNKNTMLIYTKETKTKCGGKHTYGLDSTGKYGTIFLVLVMLTWCSLDVYTGCCAHRLM